MKNAIWLAVFALLFAGCLQAPQATLTVTPSATLAASLTPTPAATPSPQLARACLENGTCLFIEVADTPEERRVGLMNRLSLPKNQGMLFVHEETGVHSYWMKNTKISLDLAWLDENFTIVDVQQMVPCQEEECPIYEPAGPSKYALETNLGVLFGKVQAGQKIRVENLAS